jgi:hypothetical protein
MFLWLFKDTVHWTRFFKEEMTLWSVSTNLKRCVWNGSGLIREAVPIFLGAYRTFGLVSLRHSPNIPQILHLHEGNRK